MPPLLVREPGIALLDFVLLREPGHHVDVFFGSAKIVANDFGCSGGVSDQFLCRNMNSARRVISVSDFDW